MWRAGYARRKAQGGIDKDTPEGNSENKAKHKGRRSRQGKYKESSSDDDDDDGVRKDRILHRNPIGLSDRGASVPGMGVGASQPSSLGPAAPGHAAHAGEALLAPALPSGYRVHGEWATLPGPGTFNLWPTRPEDGHDDGTFHYVSRPVTWALMASLLEVGQQLVTDVPR